MAQSRSFSPTLLLVGAMAVVAGSAASLLGVGTPSSTLLAGASGVAASPALAIDVILVTPVIVLVGVIAWSLLRSGGSAMGRTSALAAVIVVALVMVGVVWVLHQTGSLPTTATGHFAGAGDHGSGGSGGRGNGSGQGSGSGIGSNGTGGSGGGAGNQTGGNGSHSGNGSNGTGGTNHTGGGGHSGGGGGSGGSGGNSTGGGSGGSSGTNRSTPVLSAFQPPPASAWPIFAAATGLSLLVGTILVPRLAARAARRREASTLFPRREGRARAARAFQEAAANLRTTSDPRGVIVHLYTQLMARLEPRVEIPTSRTPDEIRTAHLLPLGVRAEAATHLTHLFEEACYSSHAMTTDAVQKARESIELAEYDLRAARAIG